jgi:hypothetical protein
VHKQRLVVIDKLGETDSDRAAEFLSVELDHVDVEPEAAQDKLLPGRVCLTLTQDSLALYLLSAG